jgi:Lysine methyltransferase
MPDHPDLDAPLTLTGLFPDEEDSDDEENDGSAGSRQDFRKGNGDVADNGAATEHDVDQGLTYEVQNLSVAGELLKVRQFDYHSHNANRVWPGTLNLAEYLMLSPHCETSRVNASSRTRWGGVLELGTATGLLAIRLAMCSSVYRCQRDSLAVDESSASLSIDPCLCDDIVTSDVADEDNLVERNLQLNYALNGFSDPLCRPHHVPHTWGTGWDDSVQRASVAGQWEIPTSFDTVVASDILLYVNSYPALVQTLCEIIPNGANTTLIMSWNRRMKESRDFFDRMVSVGFEHVHAGKCIYTFRRRRGESALDPVNEAS